MNFPRGGRAGGDTGPDDDYMIPGRARTVPQAFH